MAEVRFEYDLYLPGDWVTIIYNVDTEGYLIIVRDPDKTISEARAIIGDRRYSFLLSRGAKEGTYVVSLFRHFMEVDSDIMSVGAIRKRVTFKNNPMGATITVSKPKT